MSNTTRHLDLIVTATTDGVTEEVSMETLTAPVFTDEEFLSEFGTSDCFTDITSGFESDNYYQLTDTTVAIYTTPEDIEWVRERAVSFIETI